MTHYKLQSEYKNLCVSGDIHGELRSLVYKLKQLEIEDTIVIVAGDCGIGFNQIEFYEILYQEISRILEKNNCLLLFVRGNHDDPRYFENKLIDFPKMKTIPDYSVVQLADRTILSVGGAISLDRYYRINAIRNQELKKYGKKMNIYWENEFPIFNQEKINTLTKENIYIDTVISHSAPLFCYPQTKISSDDYILNDPFLFEDVKHERQTMSKIYTSLKLQGHKLKDWYYGHFHSSYVEIIESVRFKLLDIDELVEVR